MSYRSFIRHLAVKQNKRKATGSITKKRQSGVAIITALLIVTLAATVSISISTQLQLDVRRTGNLVTTDQAYIYSLLAEKSLQVILQDDELRNGFIDILINEGVAKQPLYIDSAFISVEVTDLSGCLNINALIDPDGSTDTVTEDRLNALFSNSGIANNLTQAIADWIDDDLNNTIPNGAEDGYYLNLEKPYRTAQLPLVSISELRLIKGFEDSKTYASISALIRGNYDQISERFSGPILCAINTNSDTPININTASIEVLESIQPGITQAQLDDVLQQRSSGALTTVPEVFTTPTNLTTESNYYLLKSKVIIGNANKVMYSIIYWNGTNAITLSRTQRTL
ncbi:MAG: type II secretion system minor pseudopilin GspK [Gammaproteobacteria bacterium]|nr:type II secretion system minor pseudopilin GspK [Gammaproteobacteria bacterium]